MILGAGVSSSEGGAAGQRRRCHHPADPGEPGLAERAMSPQKTAANNLIFVISHNRETGMCKVGTVRVEKGRQYCVDGDCRSTISSVTYYMHSSLTSCSDTENNDPSVMPRPVGPCKVINSRFGHHSADYPTHASHIGIGCLNRRASLTNKSRFMTIFESPKSYIIFPTTWKNRHHGQQQSTKDQDVPYWP